MKPEAQHPPQQASLPLSGEVQWTQLPPGVRDQCRALVVELLAILVRYPEAGGDDDER